MKAKETAVIFIEFQNDFCKPQGKLYSQVKGELARNQTIENAVKLLRGSREKGCKIIHCPFTLDKNWAEAKGAVGLLEGLCDNNIFAPNSWGHQIIDEMAPLDNEIVLVGKRALSGFTHTNLSELLEFGHIKNVMVAGFLTNICVQATAWSAYEQGYFVRIIPNACAATSKELQTYVETQVCPILGGKWNVDEFLSALE